MSFVFITAVTLPLAMTLPLAHGDSRMESARITLATVVYVDQKASTVVPAGKGYTVKYAADNVDLTGPYRVVWNLYSDGALVWSQKTELITKSGDYERKFAKPIFPPGDKKLGPFYLCASAENPAGEKSPGAPCSAVLWLGIEVPLARVSNGCGGQTGSAKMDKLLQKNLDTQKIGRETVIFKPACDVHDAGYSGLTVKDPIMNFVIDFRASSRKQIDDTFKNNLMAMCASHPEVIVKCLGYGSTYYNVVRKVGMWFFDADPTKPTAQRKYVEEKGRTDAPLGVGRVNN